MTTPHAQGYAAAGVDTDRGAAFLKNLLHWVRRTSENREGGMGRSVMDIGYFASVIDIGQGMGMALTTDGVGTKILVAELAGRYDTIGIDCIAMNVNDLICVGAEPLSMVDYLAIEDPDPEVASQIGKGLYEGAKKAGITIPGGELAQLKEMVKGARPGAGVDLAGAAFGLVPLTNVNTGSRVAPGDAIIGLRSTGLHSNGFTLARKVLLQDGGLAITDTLPSIGRTLGEELLTPTHIYVPEWKALRDQHIALHAILNITGDGLFNLTRVDAPVGFVIDRLIPPPPIFEEIKERGGIPDSEMYEVFNMGLGFCFVVPEREVPDALNVLARFPMHADVIGRVVEDREKKVQVQALRLVGKNGHFYPA